MPFFMRAARQFAQRGPRRLRPFLRYASGYSPSNDGHATITIHPCEVLPYKAFTQPELLEQSIKEPIQPISAFDETNRNLELLRNIWNAAPTSPANLGWNHWGTNDEDRTRYGIAAIYDKAMVHEFMGERYQDMLKENNLASPETTEALIEIFRLSNLLKKVAKQTGAKLHRLNPEADFAKGIERLFFSDYTPADYLKASSRNLPSVEELLSQLMEHSLALTQGIETLTQGRSDPEAEAIQKRMQALPPWGPNAEPRLSSPDVVAAAEHVIRLMGLGEEADEKTLLQAIETVSNQPGTVFKRTPGTPFGDEDHTIELIRLYNMFGERTKKLVLANFDDNTVFHSAQLLLLLTHPTNKPKIMPTPLVESGETQKRLPEFLKGLLETPYFLPLAHQMGMSAYLALSDVGLSCGAGPGNHRARACLHAVTEMMSKMFTKSDAPSTEITLGVGSTSLRGYFAENPGFGYDPHLLPFPFHPKIQIGATVQPGKPQILMATPEGAQHHMVKTASYNQDTPEREQLAEDFAACLEFMEDFVTPGEAALHEITEDPDSEWQRELRQSSLVDQVLNEQVGSRHKPQCAKDVKNFNELRAIKVHAIAIRTGISPHALTFLFSVRAFLTKHPANGLRLLAELYQTNRYFKAHVYQEHQSMAMVGNPCIIRRSGLSVPYQRKMISMFDESRAHLEKISGGQLPHTCSLYQQQQKLLGERIRAQDEGADRYWTIGVPLAGYGTYA